MAKKMRVVASEKSSMARRASNGRAISISSGQVHQIYGTGPSIIRPSGFGKFRKIASVKREFPKPPVSFK